MKKVFLLMVVIALVGLPAFAQKDENNRIKNAGKVMTEILNVPDDIPGIFWTRRTASSFCLP